MNLWNEFVRGSKINLNTRFMIESFEDPGFNAYKTIIKAIRLHPEFDWPLIYRLVPHESTLIHKLIKKYGDAFYAGYDKEAKQDLCRLNFPTLAWISMHLLYKCEPSKYSGVSNYVGFKSDLPHKQRIETLLNAYCNRGLSEEPVTIDECKNAKEIYNLIMEVNRK